MFKTIQRFNEGPLESFPWEGHSVAYKYQKYKDHLNTYSISLSFQFEIQFLVLLFYCPRKETESKTPVLYEKIKILHKVLQTDFYIQIYRNLVGIENTIDYM